jgi:hypothetical protein
MADEQGPPRVHEEDAVLDIGGDIGALVLYAGESLREREVEISPIGDDERRTHTAIHERRVGDQVVYAGIFPQLREGRYRLWTDDAGLTSEVDIAGGEVSRVDWRRAT